MEHERCEKQTPIQFRCKKILPVVEKVDNPYPVTAGITETDEKGDPGYILASPTPQKPDWRSKAKGVAYAMKEKLLEDARSKGAIAQPEVSDFKNTSDGDSLVSESSELCPLAHSRLLKDGEIELPEKYKTLDNLFNRMESSIRLLALRKKLPTFQNICTQVEILTRRKFLCNHLAQMKHVFPEAIHIEKILIHDEKSLCMKQDMKITLVLDAIKSLMNPDQSASMVLCQAFQAKLLELFSTSPEDADIPEALLPEPFNRTKYVALHDASVKGPPVEVPQQASLDCVPLSSASHFSSSFCRQISQKVIVPETKLTQLLASPASLVSIRTDNEDTEFSKSPLSKEVSCSISGVKSPDQMIYAPCHDMISQFLECTPAKYDSSADELVTETPALQTPKRPIPTPHEKLVMEDGKSVPEPKLTPSVRRSLIYSPSKSGGSVLDLAVCTIEQNKATKYSCERIATSKRSVLGEELGVSSTNLLQGEGVKAISAIEGHMLSQVSREMRQELLVCLPKMFDTICLISQSLDYSFITKQELVHKIILNNLEIEETGEVEEQLSLLEELAPDWICKKSASTGDFLYSFKRTSDPESIRARLVEAV